jgi:hypothetical protein
MRLTERQGDAVGSIHPAPCPATDVMTQWVLNRTLRFGRWLWLRERLLLERCRTEMSCAVQSAVQTWVNSSVSTKRNTPSGGETAGQSQQHGALQEVDLAHTLYPEPQLQGLPPS